MPMAVTFNFFLLCFWLSAFNFKLAWLKIGLQQFLIERDCIYRLSKIKRCKDASDREFVCCMHVIYLHKHICLFDE